MGDKIKIACSSLISSWQTRECLSPVERLGDHVKKIDRLYDYRVNDIFYMIMWQSPIDIWSISSTCFMWQVVHRFNIVWEQKPCDQTTQALYHELEPCRFSTSSLFPFHFLCLTFSKTKYHRQLKVCLSFVSSEWVLTLVVVIRCHCFWTASRTQH